MYIPVKLSIPLPFNWLYKCFFKIKNLFLRPKLGTDTKLQTIVFKAQDNREYHYRYFCLLITNKTSGNLHINPGSIKINNESYQFVIQMENNFLLLNPRCNKHWIKCENDVYTLYSANWLEISQNKFSFILKPYETKVFPMKLIKAGSHIITAVKKNSLLFNERNKFCLSIEINKENYEYGLNRKYAYEKYINYLAFYMDFDDKTSK